MEPVGLGSCPTLRASPNNLAPPRRSSIYTARGLCAFDSTHPPSPFGPFIFALCPFIFALAFHATLQQVAAEYPDVVLVATAMRQTPWKCVGVCVDESWYLRYRQAA